jgi:predicted DNA binding CopG/RHH family protein
MQKHPDILKASNKAHTAHINLFVHPQLQQAIKQAAKAQNVPVSRLYRQALELYTETVL